MKPIKTNCLDRWIAALKSGTYRQHHGHLQCVKSDGEKGYCGLGVLMEELKMWGMFNGAKPVVAYALGNAGLTRDVQARASALCSMVVSWNDHERVSLPEIGERVERVVERWREVDAVDGGLA